MAERYAVYYSPEKDSGLARFGNRWLGRCPETGELFVQPGLPSLPGLDPGSLTGEPRRYGFHATLVPPFSLRAGLGPDALMEQAARFAAFRKPFDLGPLSVREIGSFVAMVPSSRNGVTDLAADCVRAFHPLRAEPSLAEMERRRAKGLTPAQERNLLRWGYPYVFDEFRFHLTLTDSIADSRLRRKLVKGLAGISATVRKAAHPVRELCIFHQEDEAAPFRLVRRIPFTG
ncbi:MAG: DUF1045 domain-containing protein [Desulfovibrionaceae bacterium]|nr:DUF1045 domain-containing protein [Desulfovibrionaceae bacterium]